MQPRKVPLQGSHRYAEAPGCATHAGSWKRQRIDHRTDVVSRTDVMAQNPRSGGRVGGDCVQYRLVHCRPRPEPVAGDRRPPQQRDGAGVEIERRQGPAGCWR